MILTSCNMLLRSNRPSYLLGNLDQKTYYFWLRTISRQFTNALFRALRIGLYLSYPFTIFSIPLEHQTLIPKRMDLTLLLPYLTSPDSSIGLSKVLTNSLTIATAIFFSSHLSGQ